MLEEIHGFRLVQTEVFAVETPLIQVLVSPNRWCLKWLEHMSRNALDDIRHVIDQVMVDTNFADVQVKITETENIVC